MTEFTIMGTFAICFNEALLAGLPDYVILAGLPLTQFHL